MSSKGDKAMIYEISEIAEEVVTAVMARLIEDDRIVGSFTGAHYDALTEIVTKTLGDMAWADVRGM
jgi:hypothetical protein